MAHWIYPEIVDVPQRHVSTNKEAADIIRDMVEGMTIPRGCPEITMALRKMEALCKAIEVLENTPDEVDN